MDWATQVGQQNKVTDVLGARVAVVPGRRAADLGTLRDPNQARSLGRKHWPSKQGITAGSIGRASKEYRHDSLVEQLTRVWVRIFSVLDLFELSSENPAVCWYQDAVE
jgi:hypothetical protein